MSGIVAVSLLAIVLVNFEFRLPTLAGSGDAIVQRVSDLVQGHEVQVNEALEDWRATISKFTAMMEDHAGIVHSLEASRSQYESRQVLSVMLLLDDKAGLQEGKGELDVRSRLISLACKLAHREVCLKLAWTYLPCDQ